MTDKYTLLVGTFAILAFGSNLLAWVAPTVFLQSVQVAGLGSFLPGMMVVLFFIPLVSFLGISAKGSVDFKTGVVSAVALFLAVTGYNVFVIIIQGGGLPPVPIGNWFVFLGFGALPAPIGALLGAKLGAKR